MKQVFYGKEIQFRVLKLGKRTPQLVLHVLCTSLNLTTTPRYMFMSYRPTDRLQKGSLILLKLGILKVHDKYMCASFVWGSNFLWIILMF